MKNPVVKMVAVGAASLLALAACSSGNNGASTTKPADGTSSAAASSSSSAAAHTLKISASFYPIAWLTEQIGGDAVDVNVVTPANVEPHDFELAPADISKLEKADAIIYVDGFQSSLDDAVATISGPTLVELSSVVDLQPLAPGTEEEGEAGHTSTSKNASMDPHFWLDPQRMESAADKIAQQLTELAPDQKDAIAANLTKTRDELSSLDSSYAAGLKNCERTTIVTGHAAFGYMAGRYGLTQVPISGIDPESEPSPADLAAVKKVIQETGTTTVFSEELVSPKTAEAVASETGAKTEVLSPIESQPEGGDYLSGMKKDLSTLQTALGCTAK